MAKRLRLLIYETSDQAALDRQRENDGVRPGTQVRPGWNRSHDFRITSIELDPRRITLLEVWRVLRREQAAARQVRWWQSWQTKSRKLQTPRSSTRFAWCVAVPYAALMFLVGWFNFVRHLQWLGWFDYLLGAAVGATAWQVIAEQAAVKRKHRLEVAAALRADITEAFERKTPVD